jgi:heme exporter protein CcmD
MEHIATLLDMGGYDWFVWPAFALTAAVMIGLFVSTWRGLRARERALEDRRKLESHGLHSDAGYRRSPVR